MPETKFIGGADKIIAGRLTKRNSTCFCCCCTKEEEEEEKDKRGGKAKQSNDKEKASRLQTTPRGKSEFLKVLLRAVNVIFFGILVYLHWFIQQRLFVSNL